MARRTKARAAETREAVISAAVDVFFRRGVAKATLDEIAKVAGVTRGAVYFHFRDKAELALIIDERARLPLDELLVRLNGLDAEDLSPGPIDALADAVAASLASLEADPDRLKVLTVLLLRFDYTDESVAALERQKQADLAVRAACCRIFKAAAAHGALAPPWTPEGAALAVQSLAAGLVQTWLRASTELSLATDGAAALRALLGSMRAPTP